MSHFFAYLATLLLIGFLNPLLADSVNLSPEGLRTYALPANQVDFVRENLIHIFDSANFHQLEGGALPIKDPVEIKAQLKRLQEMPHIQMSLDEPARIIVENRELRAVTMWVTVRASDGYVYDWIIQEANGNLVSLAKPRGELIVQFAPYVRKLIQSYP